MWTNYFHGAHFIHDGHLSVAGHLPNCTSARALLVQMAMSTENSTWFVAAMNGGTAVATRRTIKSCAQHAHSRDAWFSYRNEICTTVHGAQLMHGGSMKQRAYTRPTRAQRRTYIERELEQSDCLFKSFKRV
jgi:hypothetical protein